MNQRRVVMLRLKELARETAQIEVTERAIIIVSRAQMMRRVPRWRRAVGQRPGDGGCRADQKNDGEQQFVDVRFELVHNRR